MRKQMDKSYLVPGCDGVLAFSAGMVIAVM